MLHNQLLSRISNKIIESSKLLATGDILAFIKAFLVHEAFRLKMEEVEIRPASLGDYDAVMELSRATYENKGDQDHDCIPTRFNGWLTEPKRAVFVAQIDDRIVGLRTFAIVNDGRSSACDVEKIHPQFRRQGLQIKMIEVSRNFVRKNYPNVARELFYAPKKFYARRQELFADQMLFKQDMIAYHLDLENFDKERLNEVANSLALEVRPCTKEEFADEILSIAGKLFPNEIFTMDGQALEASFANKSAMLKDGDMLLVDSNEDESEPFKSYSHGRISVRSKSLHWECYIYTKSYILFQVHLLGQVKCASEALADAKSTVKSVIVIHFLSDSRLVSYGRKLLEGILGFKPYDPLNMKQEYVHEESLE